MSEQEINIAIAEWCGWVGIINETGYTKDDSWSKCCPHFVNSSERKGWWFASIPDFCRDLNAMHEAEKHLSEQDEDRYTSRLVFDLIGPENGNLVVWEAITADARQRAESLLRTIGKWSVQQQSLP